jgi:photosystem II stability/assembly factor-like uncharacterized protein
MKVIAGILACSFALGLCLAECCAQEIKEPDPATELKYRSIGPAAGGRVSRSVGVSGNPMIYYAATASGGVWKTEDGGLTWKPIFDDQPTSSIGAVAVAPSDANVVYVGSGEANIRGNVAPGNGIYKSTDAGKTWRHVWKQEGQISRIVVHPTNADIAYAAVLGHAFGANPERGVYRTLDGGHTWQQVLKKDADTGAIDLRMDPSNPRILFAALWQARRRPWGFSSGGPGSGLYRSADGGSTWKHLSEKGLPDGILGRIGLDISSDGQRVYALIEAKKGGLYRSDDAGTEWKLVNSHRYLQIRPWYFSVVTVDPRNADVVWCPSLRMLKSIDGGLTFKQVKGPHHVDHHDLWIDPKDPKRMIDSNDGGVDITLDGGKSWHAPALPISQFYHVSVDNRVPYHVAGAMQDISTASGPSNSLAKGGINLSHWHTVGGGEAGYTASDPLDPSVIYAGEYGGFISRFDFRTRQARNVSIYPTNPSGFGARDLRYRFQWTAPILISPHDSRTIYHAANVLFKTTNAGTTWTVISPDLTRDDKSKQAPSGGPLTGDNTGAEVYCTIFAIAESPKQAGILWAGSDDGLVHVSRDGGTSWTNVTTNIPGIPDWGTVCCIEASRRDAATAYLVVDAHRLDDQRPYLYKTTDFGKSWTSLTAKLPQDDYVRVLREDPQVPGMLYIGSEHGVSYSRDDGVSWQRLKLNLPTVAVSDLAVKDSDLVVATQGRSLWILDDLTPYRSPKKGTQLFSCRPAIRWRYHEEIHEDKDAGKNPPQGALVNYRLDKKAEGEITLDVLDAKGIKVRSLSSKKMEPEIKEDDPDTPWEIYKTPVLTRKAGLNRVAWDLRYKGADLIPGAKNDGGVPQRGPYVTPGVYIVKLHVGGETLTSSVQVLLDPRVRASPLELEDQLRMTLQIRDDISRLSGMVIRLRKIRTQLRERDELLQGNAAAAEAIKQGKELIRKIDALEEKFHNPKAEVTYDILGQGARLYSQLAMLYEFVNDSDGAITQGMREVYAGYAKELRGLEAEYINVVADLGRLNELGRTLDLPNVIVPPDMKTKK